MKRTALRRSFPKRFLFITRSAYDDLHSSLTLSVVIRGYDDLGEVVTAAPRGIVDGLDLNEVGSGADIAEGGYVIAERSLLTWHLKVFHQAEVVLGEVGHWPATTAH